MTAMSTDGTPTTNASLELEPQAVDAIERYWADRATGPSRKILIGATLAFAELGYHGASTRAIAARADMSPAAVYIHFASKVELFHHIALEGHKTSTGAFNEPAELVADPASKLRMGVASFATFNAEMNTFSRTIEYEMRLHHDQRFADVWRLRRGVEDHMRRILQAGVDEGVFRIADIEWMKILLLSNCIDIARWYRHESPHTPMALGFRYADLAMSLVGAVAP